ncbi:MAG: patatin-like phospholipase family protein [Deltaproteobacteria bacterium]|nr:patatin-like phospholipase family protein [Deltaproteobacteria bacterium]
MTNSKTALVLSGGGARGAYEAGVLYHLREKVAPDRHGFAIHCGTSAGSLNSCFLAATAHDPTTQGKKLRLLWENLRSSDVYRGDFGALTQLLARSAAYTTTHLFGLSGLIKKWAGDVKPFQGILDTSPFIPFLKKAVPFSQIRTNIKKGLLDAIAIATTNLGNGKLELFIDKQDSVAYTGAYRIKIEPIDWVHAMASAAVPIIFPPIRIGRYFYVDGSIRQNTPMSPAVQLGADKIMIIGVKYKPNLENSGSFPANEESPYPSFTHMAGKLLDALFLDHIDYDLEQMTRINRVIEWSEQLYGPTYLEDINTMLRNKKIKGDIANRGLKKIEAFSFFPSEDIGKIACERLMKLSRNKAKLSQVERFLLKFMEVDPKADMDLLSYLLFEKEYIGSLIDIGIKDCKAREKELARFLT